MDTTPQGSELLKLSAQVENEYGRGLEFSRKKRDRFTSRDKRYINIADQETKTYDRLVFSVVQTLQSLVVMDKPQVSFSVKGLFFDELEEKIKATAENDYEEMGMDALKDQKSHDMFYYGVALEAFEGFDNGEKLPRYKLMNPMTWICDPDYDPNNGFTFHGFECQASLTELTEDNGYMNVANLEMEVLTELQDKAKRSTAEVRDYNVFTTTTTPVYHHYTKWNGRRVLTSRALSRRKLIRYIEIPSINAKEESNPSGIPCPVIATHRCPMRNDPRGICTWDILEDKQRASQLFMNLNRIKAEHEAWGNIFFYDPNVVKKITDIQNKGSGPVFVSADLSRGNPVYELPQGRVTQDSMNMPEVLLNKAYNDLGTDARGMGSSAGQSNITATENQRVQGNSNLRQLLGMRRIARGEKDFWGYRYRMYQIYFKGKKIFKSSGRYSSKYYELAKTDLVTYQHINIKIESLKESEEKNERKKLHLTAMLQTIYADPSRPLVSKRVAERELHRLNGLEQETIDIICPETKETKLAKMWLELINRDEMPPPITDLNEDHIAYIMIYQRARDTSAKYKAITDRMNALTMSGKYQQGQQQTIQGDNQLKGQVINQLAQSQGKQATSLQSVAPTNVQ